jgi:hypothetical protein
MVWVVLLFVGCTMPSSPIVAGDTEEGDAEVSITTGTIGMLAKSAAIEMDKLCLSICAVGACPGTAIRDSFPLTSTSGTTLTRVYSKLAKDKDWILSAQSFDKSGRVVHSGTTTFKVQSCQTAKVNLELQAGFSMLAANVFPIPDSVNGCVLFVDQTAVDNSVFTRGTRIGDTVTMTFDYLGATPAGTRHALRVEVHGILWGKQQLLYAGDTALIVVSGQDKSYTLSLKWVGPASSPYGSAEMKVVLGAVGTSTVNAVIPGEPSSFIQECMTPPAEACNAANPAPGCQWSFTKICCCKCGDASGLYDYSNVLDVGRVIINIDILFEVLPNGLSGCLTDGSMEYSEDGKVWFKFWSKTQMKTGEKQWSKTKVSAKFRYIRTTTKNCPAEWTYVTLVQG